MSLFGKNPTAKSVFGGASGVQPSSVFGSKPTNQPSSVFGSKPTNQPSSVFGSKPTNQPSSVFGGRPTTQPSSGFNTNETNNPTSLFSSSQTARVVKPASNSLFGKQTQAVAGGTKNNVTPQSLFGGAQAQPVQQQANTASSSLFRNNNSSTSARSVFGGGASTNLPPAGIQPLQQPTNSLFVKPAPSNAPAAKAQTLFGKPAPGAFSSDPSTNPSRLYSQMEVLTSEEIAAFSADEFSMGCIPLKLPPRELCAV